MPPRLSRSRAFWNLRAEQVMDQVFHPSDAALQSVQVALLPQTSARQEQRSQSSPPQGHRHGLLIGTAVIALLGVGTSLWLGQNWQRALQSLNRERNLQMIERLRTIPIAGEESSSTAVAATPTADNNLQREEAPRAASLQPLSIPLAGTLPAPTEFNLSEETIAAALVPAEPLLVGVVHAGGGQGSAIFQLDQLSLSAAPGEAIGNSGWHLKAVKSDGAVIEHNGEERRLGVGGAF